MNGIQVLWLLFCVDIFVFCLCFVRKLIKTSIFSFFVCGSSTIKELLLYNLYLREIRAKRKKICLAIKQS